MSKLPPHHEGIAELVESLCQGEMTSEQIARLETLLRTDKGARQYYVRYLHMHASLRLFSGCESGKQELARLQELVQSQGSEVGPSVQESRPSASSSGESKTPGASVLGFLGECVQQGASFLSKSSVFSLLVAIGLPGLVLLLLVVGLVDQAPVERGGPVATVARARDCVGYLGDGRTRLSPGMELAEGQRLTLRRGLVEIEFTGGARAILEAPTAFEVRRDNAGFLQMGRLAANVPPQAHGFAVETPLVTVVDLGTDFGVSVAADGTAETHVFAGQIEVTTKTMPENPISLTKRLRVGQAARICMTDAPQQVARIEPISASSDEFVRYFPVGLAKESALQPHEKELAKRLIASVGRRGGMTDNRAPIGPFDGETDPLPSGESGLRLGSPYYSDRVYPVETIDEPLVGAEYVRTFNGDKKSADYHYDVAFTTSRNEVFLMLVVDDRFKKARGGQQAEVDRIVSRFAHPGAFVDTGYDIDVDDSEEPHPLSAFGMMVPTKDESGKLITYTFLASSLRFRGRSMYVIAVMREPPRPRSSPQSKE